jgi:hypothetical protein
MKILFVVWTINSALTTLHSTAQHIISIPVRRRRRPKLFKHMLKWKTTISVYLATSWSLCAKRPVKKETLTVTHAHFTTTIGSQRAQ